MDNSKIRCFVIGALMMFLFVSIKFPVDAIVLDSNGSDLSSFIDLY